MRIVLGFDLSNINLDSVATAKLVMTVQDNPGGWGIKGRNVAVRPLKGAGFVEGNGQWLGVPADLKTAGNGKGVTWNCETDNKISNTVKNCTIAGMAGDPIFRLPPRSCIRMIFKPETRCYGMSPTT